MLFWIIVGSFTFFALCFLVGEYLQDRRTAKAQREKNRPKQTHHRE